MLVARALALAIPCFVMLLLSVGPLIRGSAVGGVPMPIPRDALADRADQILRKLR
jgi:hypothetical protein